MKDVPSIDPLKGVHNSDEMVKQLRLLKAGKNDGNIDPRSYVRGSLQWLERHPPNKYIVPILKAALKKY